MDINIQDIKNMLQFTGKFICPVVIGIIGYVAGIYKERNNKIWQDKRNALKAMDKLLLDTLQVVQQKPCNISQEYFNEYNKLFNDSLLFVPPKIRNKFREVYPLIITSNERAKLVYDFRCEIAKELSKCFN